ncbi:uncharacterized protein IL334_002802 [Kwoniella shivajii]|uniref:Uncharacterized protein n=1 Tax=Kwoniella shivajii TaxID=564305 RepID=A0ABZ1CW41_9TREE|nr:hypothetical protein IL334_002802 [Kwoniella shivajii]
MTSLISSPDPIPLSPTYSPSGPSHLDAEALTSLIRQLRRSPESSSGLTLPPIMGVIDEEDEDPSEIGGDDEDSSTIHSDNCEFEEEEIVWSESILYTIDEESEEDFEQSASDTSFTVDNDFGSEDIPPSDNDNEGAPPVDRYSPPPPSPNTALTPSPTLPETPCFPNILTSHPIDPCDSVGDLVSSSTSDQHGYTSQADDQFNDSSEITPLAPCPIPEVLPSQRRRRRTLGDLEKYRRTAIERAAWTTHWDIQAAELKRMQREREYDEAVWMNSNSSRERSRSGERQRGRRPKSIVRAQSFPPTQVRSSILSLRSNCHDDMICYGNGGEGQPQASSWDDESAESQDEFEVEHIEFSEPDETNVNEGVEGRDEIDEDVLSPLSDHIKTPMLSENGLDRRISFPSSSYIFGASSFHAPGTGKEPNQGLGLGLNLMGIARIDQRCPTVTQPAEEDGSLENAKDFVATAEDQPLDVNLWRPRLPNIKVDLQEVSLSSIIPSRPYKDLLLAGKDHTAEVQEKKNARGLETNIIEDGRVGSGASLDDPNRGRSRTSPTSKTLNSPSKLFSVSLPSSRSSTSSLPSLSRSYAVLPQRESLNPELQSATSWKFSHSSPDNQQSMSFNPQIDAYQSETRPESSHQRESQGASPDDSDIIQAWDEFVDTVNASSVDWTDLDSDEE